MKRVPHMKCRNGLWISAIVSLSLASLGGNVAVFAQTYAQEARKNFYWVNVGVGGSSFGGGYGLGVYGQFGLHLFSLQCAGGHNVETIREAGRRGHPSLY